MLMMSQNQKDQAAKEQAAKDQFAKEQAAKEQAAKEQAAKDQKDQKDRRDIIKFMCKKSVVFIGEDQYNVPSEHLKHVLLIIKNELPHNAKYIIENEWYGGKNKCVDMSNHACVICGKLWGYCICCSNCCTPKDTCMCPTKKIV
jgi:hypothetical protein